MKKHTTYRRAWFRSLYYKLFRIRQWSALQIYLSDLGWELWPRKTILGTLEHIKSEIIELEDALHEKPFSSKTRMELADLCALAYDLAAHLGFDLHNDILAKMEINRNREWDQPNELGVIADDGTNDYSEDDDGNKIVNHDHIKRSQLRVNTRQWNAARRAPKKWGDRSAIEMSGPEGGPAQVQIILPSNGRENLNGQSKSN